MDTVTAGCKINLGLRITGKRTDGYHEIDSIFWPLPEPHDTMKLRLLPYSGITLHCDATEVCPTDNTLTKAYTAMAEFVDEIPGVEVNLYKGIPSGAGLGGGSSDGAALLSWLNKNILHPLPDRMLAQVALRAGADMPFFLQPFPCHVSGIGDKLTPITIPSISGRHLVLVCPAIHASTPQAYEDYDKRQTILNPRNSLTNSDCRHKKTFPVMKQFMPDLYNDLENVVLVRHQQIAIL
ncbi:MAG: 4-(cytidine 5'-diphospho)-2-C-methyl-D-erythritol kinase, partial [Desulfovibrio sp.]|nr:4-(cytidine 5'-diphospho)-2-C-methyl-D-erythritol kinase [Desulfovibrio sp.]